MLGYGASAVWNSTSVTPNSPPNNFSWAWVSDVSQATDGSIGVTKTSIDILPVAHGGTGIDGTDLDKDAVILSNNPNDSDHPTAFIS